MPDPTATDRAGAAQDARAARHSAQEERIDPRVDGPQLGSHASLQRAVAHLAAPVAIDDMRAHPRNYRAHPADQLDHLAASLREHGQYRNVVIARDGTILAGHGVVQAARSIGLAHVLAVRLDVDPDSPEALKVLTGDNELGRLAEVNDRTLVDLLKSIRDSADLLGTGAPGLLGTGFDEMMLANLAMVTRADSEIADFDAAAEWVGLPSFKGTPESYRIVIQSRTEQARAGLVEKLGLVITHTEGRTVSAWWPAEERRSPMADEYVDGQPCAQEDA